jgi:hypothetical protein
MKAGASTPGQEEIGEPSSGEPDLTPSKALFGTTLWVPGGACDQLFDNLVAVRVASQRAGGSDVVRDQVRLSARA